MKNLLTHLLTHLLTPLTHTYTLTYSLTYLLSGYIDISSSTEIIERNFYKEIESEKGGKQSRFCWQVKDGETVVTLAAPTEAERSSWIAALKEAVSGTQFYYPPGTHSPTHSPTRLLTHLLTHSLTGFLTYLLTYSRTHSLTHSLTHLLTHLLTLDCMLCCTYEEYLGNVSAAPISDNQVELPRKVGLLNKKSLDGILGMKVTNARYFRLDGGELNYYLDEGTHTHSLTGLLTGLLTHSLTHSLTYLLTHSLTYLLLYV